MHRDTGVIYMAIMRLMPAALALLLSWHCHAQVYSAGIYASGTAYYELSSAAFDFPPYKYKLATTVWREDTNGFTIMDILHTNVPGDVLHSSLEVECGAATFVIPVVPAPKDGTKSSDGLPVVKGSGDLTELMMQCVTKRGGHTASHTLPVVRSSWVSQSRTNQDIIVAEGDYFDEVQKVLYQAYGKPSARIDSSTNGNGRSLTYRPEQVGIALNLTGGLGLTILSVMDKQQP